MKVTQKTRPNTNEIIRRFITIRKLWGNNTRRPLWIGRIPNNYDILTKNMNHSPSEDWFCGERTSISHTTETLALKRPTQFPAAKRKLFNLSVFFCNTRSTQWQPRAAWYPVYYLLLSGEGWIWTTSCPLKISNSSTVDTPLKYC